MAAVSWERRRYALWAPVYDLVVAPLRRARASSIAALELRAGERVLVVGAGTGEDLPYLPAGVSVFAVDLTPAMLARARRRPRPPEHLAVMDAEALAVPSGAFDAVVLHLILAVVRDPARCFAEAARAVRPGGRIAVFDKFVPAGEKPSPAAAPAQPRDPAARDRHHAAAGRHRPRQRGGGDPRPRARRGGRELLGRPLQEVRDLASAAWA